MELVRDHETLEPAGREASRIIDEMRLLHELGLTDSRPVEFPGGSVSPRQMLAHRMNEALDLPGEDVVLVLCEAEGFDDAGRVTHFGLPAGELEDIIQSGLPFRTSGCPGKVQDDISACDRPYGDSPPSDIASYPFQPDKKDIKKIRKQLGIPNRLV